MTDPKPRHLQPADQRVEEGPIHHPKNERCEMYYSSLGDAAGLERIGVHLVRIPPGREANIYHAHRVEEEFYFIVSGRGQVELDGAVHDVAAGDFIGLPTNVAHQLRNPSDEDLVYLVGGERQSIEVASFPKHAQHVIRTPDGAWIVDDEHLQSRSLSS